MKKFTYSAIAMFVSFFVGVSVVASLLYFNNFSIKYMPNVESKDVSNISNTMLSQNNTTDLQEVSNKIIPLPCDDSDADPSKPWVRRSEILDSFPPDNPLPKFIGTFRDEDWHYMIDLYRDSQGIFGEISSPVMEADSPTSRLYNVVYDSSTGSLQFRSSPSLGSIQFDGFLHSKSIKGKFTQYGDKKTVTLKKLGSDYDSSFTSRAQFGCAMKLFGRY